MSSRGYSFESEMEGYFLDLEGKKRQDPIWDSTGRICRTFRVPTSGMMASMPGDVITGNHKFVKQFMVECKARYHIAKKAGQVFRLDMDWVYKNETEAAKAGYVPFFVLSFKRQKKHRIWAVLDHTTYVYLFGTPTNILTPLFVKKKKTVVLIKSYLDQNTTVPMFYENRYFVTWESCYERIKKWTE